MMPIHAASNQGTLPLDEYRRLRLCRATGDLPRSVAIPAGLSCENDAAQVDPSPVPVPNGQFRGNISAVKVASGISMLLMNPTRFPSARVGIPVNI